jgi:hypothetical protein
MITSRNALICKSNLSCRMTSYYCQSITHLYNAVVHYMLHEKRDDLKSVVAELAVAKHVHRVNSVRMWNMNSEFDTKSCSCASIAFLSGMDHRDLCILTWQCRWVIIGGQ